MLSLSLNVLLLGSFGGCCFSKTAGSARMSPLFICNLASCSTWIHATQYPHIPSYTFSSIWQCERKRMANCLPVVGIRCTGRITRNAKWFRWCARMLFCVFSFSYEKIVRTISNLTAPKFKRQEKNVAKKIERSEEEEKNEIRRETKKEHNTSKLFRSMDLRILQNSMYDGPKVVAMMVRICICLGYGFVQNLWFHTFYNIFFCMALTTYANSENRRRTGRTPTMAWIFEWPFTQNSTHIFLFD